jgi:hypothetical protein
MWQALYSALTTRAGMYICYLVPISYLFWVLLAILKGKRAQQKRLGPGDIFAIMALILVSIDFVYYVYLFFSHTGTLLPPRHLFLKYVVGGLLWLWIFGYIYTRYFAPKAAGSHLKSRYMQLLWVLLGSVVLGGIGVMIS